jgi:hypothetical protein
MNKDKPSPVSLTEKIQQIQFIIASILGSTAIVVWVSTWDIIKSFFLPKHIEVLNTIRLGMVAFALVAGCFVGIKGILWFLERGIQFKQELSEFSEAKRKKDGDK